jgi:mannan endo-1,4-beta-mannosidase
MFKIFCVLCFFFSGIALGDMLPLYNGETVPYSKGVAWDKNKSKICESIKNPYSPTKHIRAQIKNRNWWGGVGYFQNNYKPTDMSSFKFLSFYAKSNKKVDLIFELFDSKEVVSTQIVFQVDKEYKKYLVPLELMQKVDLKNVIALVFATSQKKNADFIVDIDDIELNTDMPFPPVPTPDPTPIPTPTPPTPGTDTIRIIGKDIQDACGQKIVMRGVNQMTCYTDWIDTPRDGLPMFKEIAKSGSNAVRIVWTYGEGLTIAQLDKAVQNAKDNALFPIIEIVDQTGKWSREAFDTVIKYWTAPDMVSIITKHQKYLIVNFANEMGTGAVTKEQWVEEYSRAVIAMRKSGIKVPIMIDTSNWGQDETFILASGKKIIEADPIHNVVFSLHVWWTDQNAARIETTMKNINAAGIPFIVGEFSSVSVDCKTPIKYKELLKYAQENQIGWLAWSWDHENECPTHAMTRDKEQTFASLWGWGLEIMTTDINSAKNTSVRSTCF